MASSKRLIDAVSAVSKTSTTPYVCASCRFAVSTGSRQQTRHQSDLPFTEKIRRKIWGTDNPPGLKDPYGGPSFLERALAERRARSGQGRSTAKPELSDTESRSQSRLESRHRAAVSQLSDAKQHRDVTEQPKEYEPAENWESLKWVGHRGEYQYMDSTPADEYTPWLAVGSKSRVGEQSLLDALHESIFDVVQPAEEEYDREAVIQVTSEGYVTRSEVGIGGDARAFETAKLGFANPEAHTFKILKNFQLVTGMRLPDPMLSKLSQNPAATFRHLVEDILEAHQKAPKNTQQALVAARDLMSQGNVKIARRRVTPVDKEKGIGRWKRITSELGSRGLPVLGSQSGRRAGRTGSPWVKPKRMNVQ